MSNELWAVHAQGPDDIYPAYDRADAERHAAELNAIPAPAGISVAAVVIPSPLAELEHWKGVAELEREHKLHLLPLVAPTDANLSAMRREGLSIDGDNTYKRDLLDTVIGAMAFGCQNTNPPPDGHWGKQFWDIGRAEVVEKDLLIAQRDSAADGRALFANEAARLRTVQDTPAELVQLRDPEAVLVNMLRGTIAVPSVRSWSKLFGQVLNEENARLLEIAHLRAAFKELSLFLEPEDWMGDISMLTFINQALAATESGRQAIGERASEWLAANDPDGIDWCDARHIDQLLDAMFGEALTHGDASEAEAWRKDAERYRWLRNPDRVPNDSPCGHLIVGEAEGEDIHWRESLDRSIDNAMALESEAACDYHGKHFGAPYPDATCINGFLWDEDSCDEPGGALRSGGDIPCPKCNAEEHAKYKEQSE